MRRPGVVLPLLVIAAFVVAVVLWRLVYVSIPVFVPLDLPTL